MILSLHSQEWLMAALWLDRRGASRSPAMNFGHKKYALYNYFEIALNVLQSQNHLNWSTTIALQRASVPFLRAMPSFSTWNPVADFRDALKLGFGMTAYARSKTRLCRRTRPSRRGDVTSRGEAKSRCLRAFSNGRVSDLNRRRPSDSHPSEF
jgi:hypothetical protein